MPAKKRPKPLYQRGSYALHRREGRQNLEIIWYDGERKRERSASAGTADVREAITALDRLYLESTGARLCPTCHRPWDHEGSPLVSQAITDYLILKSGKGDYIRHRLAHVVSYLAATDAEAVCAQVDEAWIDRFRTWALARPVVQKNGKERRRSLAHVEGSVMQLAAAINAVPGESARFKARQQTSLSRSPVYRADLATIARMFDYCLNPDGRSPREVDFRRQERANLLAYLRLAVATWARPETIYEVQREQWHSAPRVLDLIPPYRAPTDKRKPMVPIPRQMVAHLDAMGPTWLTSITIKSAWAKMRAKLELPSDREAGPKLIRRSMATLARKRLGEANWRQGEIMLGHHEGSTSDIYAVPDPANLGLALAVTEAIIDEIEALAPGAYRIHTAQVPVLAVVNGGKIG